MYHFEGRMAHHDGYYILRGLSCAATVTIIEGRVMRPERCMDRYVPHGSKTERHRVCIVREDMHHYTLHCIHGITHFIIDELEPVLCRSYECFFVKLVTVEY